MSYDGKSITYDTIGNPLSYDGTTFTWQKGRQLATISNADYDLEFRYNSDGLRTRKISDDTTIEYYYSGDALIAQYDGTNWMKFVYSADGEMVGFTYQNKAYYYIKNVQGDVMAIADDYGTIIAFYMYDAWGNPTPCDDCGDPTTDADNIAVINPIRYRGYYYDSETGLYYLQSRYYNPEWGRFINADAISALTHDLNRYNKNLYAYCDSNPNVRQDYDGKAWETVFDVISLIGSIADVCIEPTNPWAWASVIGDTLDLVPVVTGLGESVRAVKIVNKVDNVVDTTKIAKKSTRIHGNSLKSKKINYGYALLDKNNKILKFGETINPKTRYTKKYLSKNDYHMKILVYGNKKNVHLWQYDMNMYYRNRYGTLPPLNRRGWRFLMNLFINSPAYFTEKNGIVDSVYQMCKLISNTIDITAYTEIIDTIAITPIIAPQQVLNDGKWKEIRKIDLQYRMANISIVSNYDDFYKANTEMQKQIIIENIFKSLYVIKRKLKENFNYELMKSHIIKLISENTE